MKSEINYINAGILHTQARMAGLTLDQALELARTERLHADVNSQPHRATVARLLRTMWVRHDAQVARDKAARDAHEAFDAAVAAAYPEEWNLIHSTLSGKRLREKRTALRKRFAPERYNVTV